MNMTKKLSSLKEYVRNKAVSEAEDIKKAAEEKAQVIEKEYEEKAEKEYTSMLNEARRKAELLKRKEMARARAKSSKMILDAKNDILRNALDEFKKVVYSLVDSEEYENVLENLTREAIDAIGEKDVIVKVRAKDVEKMKEVAQRISKEAAVNIEISTGDDDMIGGVIVSTKAGHVVVENTLEDKYEEAKDEFVSALFSILNVDG